MAKKKKPSKSPRQRILSKAQKEVLLKSRRYCTLCWHFSSTAKPKIEGQIAHIDRDKTNNVAENFAWMCVPHHIAYDKQSPQVKRLTEFEVKSARNDLYQWIEKNIVTKKLAQKRFSIKQVPDGKQKTFGPSSRLQDALIATVNASGTPMGFVTTDSKVSIGNDLLLEFLDVKSVDGTHLLKLRDIINEKLMTEYLSHHNELHYSFYEESQNGPRHALEVIGYVDFRGERKSGRYNKLYELTLDFWPILEDEIQVGTLFLYFLAEVELEK